MKNIKPEVNLNHPSKLRVIEASSTELLLIQGAVTISVQGLEDGLRLGIGCLLWVKIALPVIELFLLNSQLTLGTPSML